MEFFKQDKKRIIYVCAGIVLVAAIVVGIVNAVSCGDSYRSIKMMKLQGKVSVERGKKTMDAYDDMRLQNSDMIATEKASSAVIKMDEDKYGFLNEETKISINASEKNSAYLNITVLQGEFIGEVHKKLSNEESMTIYAPSSAMSIRGTTYRVALEKTEDGGNKMTYSVREGNVSLRLYEKDPSGNLVVTELSVGANEAAGIELSPAFEMISAEEMAAADLKISNNEITVNTISDFSEYTSVSGNAKIEEEPFDDTPFVNAVNEMAAADSGFTPNPTVMPTATSTPTPTSTNTPTPTSTNTPVPTATSTPSPTSTSAPVPTATNTPTPTEKPGIKSEVAEQYMHWDSNYSFWSVPTKDFYEEYSEIYGVQYVIEVADISNGFGGGVIINGETNSWDQREWGNEGSGKAYIAEATGEDNEYIVTMLNDTACFHATDNWANFVITQWWGGNITVKSVRLLDRNGKVLFDSAEVEDAPTDTSDSFSLTALAIMAIICVVGFAFMNVFKKKED